MTILAVSFLVAVLVSFWRFLILFLFAFIAYAQDSPQDYVNAHNAARSQVNVPNISWDNTVAAYAQNYANQRKADCQLVHSGGKYGENLAWSSGDMSGADAVKMWVDEKAYYNYNTNSCASGKQCGHYTQVVWKNSIRETVRGTYGTAFGTCGAVCGFLIFY